MPRYYCEPIRAPGGEPAYVSSQSAEGERILRNVNSGRYTRGTTADRVLGTLGSLTIAGYSPLGVDAAPSHRRGHIGRFKWRWPRSSPGLHNLSFGFDFRRLNLDSAAQRNARPAAVFSGLVTPPTASNQPVPEQTFSSVALAAAGIPSGLYQNIAFGVEPEASCEPLICPIA